MMVLPEGVVASGSPAVPPTGSTTINTNSNVSGQLVMTSKPLLSNLFAYNFSILGPYIGFSLRACQETNPRSYRWTIMLAEIWSGSMVRRLQNLVRWRRTPDVLISTSEVWLLGVCYKVGPEELTNSIDVQTAFLSDVSSRIWMTYRKGFETIPDSNFTNDVNWGCMIRSSQMLIAQALVFHQLGRPWRRPFQKPYDPEYIEILHLFGDSMDSAFSIHNLLEAGRSYGLAAGSWVGPYAMCRTWETFARSNNKHDDLVDGRKTFPMAIYVVSDNEDGECGGAPIVCIDRAAKLCYEFSNGQFPWTPILLLVPLVLGVGDVDPRYIQSLRDTFKFPQSLGILGGKPGASSYIVGVQDDKALFLDPHEVQLAVDTRTLEADTSSYHCSAVRYMPLDEIDSSLAIGFYCRDKGDFEDFCCRASGLQEKSEGAPLFTVSVTRQSPNVGHQISLETTDSDDGWQIL